MAHEKAATPSRAVYAIVLGAFFGLAIRARTTNDGPITLLGGVRGLDWGIFTGLALVPKLLGIAPFSPAALQQARNIAVPLVIGHGGLPDYPLSGELRRGLRRGWESRSPWG